VAFAAVADLRPWRGSADAFEQGEIHKPETKADVDLAADVGTGAGAWPGAQASMEAEVDPNALTVMATADADLAAIDESTFDENLARAQTGCRYDLD
jgi:hypothetical protein